jgi:hypothetical protein
VSASAGKRKGGGLKWAAAGEFDGPAGLAGPKGEKVCFLFFLFFFKLFLKQIFLFQIQTKFFQTFSQKFYKLFRSHTATKSYAKSNNDAQPLVVSILIKLSLIF